jgi:hypothetical protein
MRLLIIGLILTSCSISHETDKFAIDGDWMYVNDTEEITVDYVGLRFENDTLYTIRDGGLFQEGKFTISGDTIIVREFGDKINKERRIKKLHKDSLILRRGVVDEKFYSRNLEFNDKLKLDEIKFTAAGCFGECPTFNFFLTNKGQVQFTPIANCKVTEKKEFIFDKKKMNLIDSLFKWTYLYEWGAKEVHFATDDWSFNIAITYNNGQEIEFKTTQSYIPFRQKRIFGLLINDLRERGLI